MRKIEITIAGVIDGKKLYAVIDKHNRTMYQEWI